MKGIKIALLVMSVALLGLGGCASMEQKAQLTSDIWFVDYDYRSYAEQGYFTVDDGFISYTNADDEATELICTNPECTHEKESCPAYFDALIIKPFIRNGQLYLVTNYEEENFGELFLYRADANGENREKIAKLSDHIEYIVKMYVSGDDFFIAYQNNYEKDMTPLEKSQFGILHYQMKEQRGELVYENESENGGIVSMVGTDDRMFFVLDYAEEDQNMTCEVWSYDLKEKKAGKMADKTADSIGLTEDTFFYEKDGALYARNLKTDQTKILDGISEQTSLIPGYSANVQLLREWHPEDDRLSYYRYDAEAKQVAPLFSRKEIYIKVLLGNIAYGYIIDPETKETTPYTTTIDEFLSGEVADTDDSEPGESLYETAQGKSGDLIWMMPDIVGKLHFDRLNERLREDGYDFQVEVRISEELIDDPAVLTKVAKNGEADIMFLGFGQGAVHDADNVIRKMAEDGLLYDFTEYLHSDEGSALYSQFDERFWRTESIGNRNYWIPNQAAKVWGSYFLLNKKYFDEERAARFDGSFQQLCELLQELEKREADVLLMKDLSFAETATLCGYCAIDGVWISLETGEACNPFELDDYWDCVRSLNSLYQRGLVDERQGRDLGQILEKEDYGVIATEFYDSNIQAHQDQYYLVKEPFTLVGSTAGGIGIRADSPNLEKARLLLQKLYTDSDYANLLIWGEEDIDYRVQDGYVRDMEGMELTNFAGEIASGLYDLVYPEIGGSLGDRKKELRQEFLDSDAYIPYPLVGFCAAYSDWREKEQALNSLLSRECEVIWTTDDIDAAIDELSARYKELGGEEWVAELNRQIGEWQAEKNR